MKNKKISYLGFVVGFISLLVMFILNDNETINRISAFILR